MKKGFTLVEILVVIGITVIVLGIVITAFNSLISTQALDRDYISVASLLEQAKSQAINSKAASQYGVYFASSTAVLFKGINYAASSTDNQIYNLNSRVNISTLNLVGDNVDRIIFERITGYASASGTITISLKNSSTTRIIKVYKTGAIEY